jgi:hypothetical protein
MEALHADLIPYVADGMIRHPLVVQLFPADVSFINQLYRQKLDKLAKAEAEGDWSQYITLHERPYHLGALCAAINMGLSDEPSYYWELVGDVWRGSENIYQNLSEWKKLWASAIDDRQACMSSNDLHIFYSLPKQLEVWRGVSYKSGVTGLSWTLNPGKAAWYAKRYRSEPHVPFLAKGLVNKRDVLAYFGERDESEIISLRVSVISVTEMGGE